MPLPSTLKKPSQLPIFLRGIDMQAAEHKTSDIGAQQQQVRAYFHEVAERCNPPLPAIVASSLRMVRDPNVNMAKLSRLLGRRRIDDAAVDCVSFRLLWSLHPARRHWSKRFKCSACARCSVF